jgi:hypothetical protein
MDQPQLWLVTCQENNISTSLFSGLNKLIKNYYELDEDSNVCDDGDFYTEQISKEQCKAICKVYRSENLEYEKLETLGGAFGIYFSFFYGTLSEIKHYDLYTVNRMCYVYQPTFISKVVRSIQMSGIETNNMIYYNNSWAFGEINEDTLVMDNITPDTDPETTQQNIDKFMEQIENFHKGLYLIVHNKEAMNYYKKLERLMQGFPVKNPNEYRLSQTGTLNRLNTFFLGVFDNWESDLNFKFPFSEKISGGAVKPDTNQSRPKSNLGNVDSDKLQDEIFDTGCNLLFESIPHIPMLEVMKFTETGYETPLMDKLLEIAETPEQTKVLKKLKSIIVSEYPIYDEEFKNYKKSYDKALIRILRHNSEKILNYFHKLIGLDPLFDHVYKFGKPKGPNKKNLFKTIKIFVGNIYSKNGVASGGERFTHKNELVVKWLVKKNREYGLIDSGFLCRNEDMEDRDANVYGDGYKDGYEMGYDDGYKDMDKDMYGGKVIFKINYSNQ